MSDEPSNAVILAEWNAKMSVLDPNNELWGSGWTEEDIDNADFGIVITSADEWPEIIT